jgi:NAD(P)-dependent dehydrogenase (short-subunit alcohol dehydrogenase family)
MLQPWAFVSPASRGIGFELVRRLLATTDVPVVMTARKNLDKVREEILDAAGKDVKENRLHVLELDVLGM